MKAIGLCRDRELLAKLLGSENVRVYLFGNVVVMARDDRDLNRFLYAVSLPKGIPLERLEELMCTEPAISRAKLCGEDVIAISDIYSFEQAIAVAHRLARDLENLSPFAVKRIDVVLTYRSSEDGGYTVRNQVIVAIDTRFTTLEAIEGIVRRAVAEIYTLCKGSGG